MPEFVSAEKAVSLIKSNDRVFIHSVAASPQVLIQAMVNRADELRNVDIVHLHTEGEAPYVQPQYRDNFRLSSFFIGPNVRKSTQEGLADYIPVFLSEIPILLRRNILPVDVAMVQVSPPDKHGFCSLGTSVDASLAAVEMAKYVIAQVNPRMPRTHGDGIVPVTHFTHLVEHEAPIYEKLPEEPDEIEQRIGQHVAGLVEDGATLQMGIGSIPNAVLAALTTHKDLGIHTEMFSDGIIPLVEKGVINGKKKVVQRGKIVSTFLLGSQKLYDFVDDNPMVRLLDVGFVNDTATIRRNPKVTAINSAIEVDLTGQVCADSIGRKMYSGVGGQMDFVRGAALSEGGKPIIALPSVTGKGISRIVATLKEGAGVVTTRAHVHYVVTEYGVAYLYGKNLRQRAQALIDIAHPQFREELAKVAGV